MAACQPEHTTSGCSGGDDVDSQCLTGLGGKLCLVCDNANGTLHYYVDATRDTPARCDLCEDSLGLTAGIVAAIVAGCVLVIYVAQLLGREARRRGLLSDADDVVRRAIMLGRTLQTKAKVRKANATSAHLLRPEIASSRRRSLCLST